VNHFAVAGNFAPVSWRFKAAIQFCLPQFKGLAAVDESSPSYHCLLPLPFLTVGMLYGGMLDWGMTQRLRTFLDLQLKLYSQVTPRKQHYFTPQQPCVAQVPR